MNTNYENNIIDAIELIVDKKISQLSFNRTIKARVIAVTDSEKGIYKLQYQDITFFGYSINVYAVDDIVYVQLLNNDFSEKKFILGMAPTDVTDTVRGGGSSSSGSSSSSSGSYTLTDADKQSIKSLVLSDIGTLSASLKIEYITLSTPTTLSSGQTAYKEYDSTEVLFTASHTGIMFIENLYHTNTDYDKSLVIKDTTKNKEYYPVVAARANSLYSGIIPVVKNHVYQLGEGTKCISDTDSIQLIYSD